MALVGIFVNLIVGLSVGPNAALANLIGQKKREYINPMIHTVLTFGVILCLPFMLVYNFGAAVLRSFGDTRRPMYYLIISGTVNVILNLILVIVFGLGVAGVAIATVISNIVSAVLVLMYLYRRTDEFQFRLRKMRIQKKDLKKILVIGIPAGIQGAIFSISNVFIQSGINSFGEDAIAGSSLALYVIRYGIYGNTERDIYSVG